jgi:D-erythrulose 1-phosphate 3-epimerase
MVTHYPKIFLAMDNSFATKRWTEPDEWARVIRDLGVTCVEASADTEADPFYCGEEYLARWVDKVLAAREKYGVRVANCYTGYSTYRSLGLGHPDAVIRKRVMDGWLKVMARTMARLKAGLGFYIHAFEEAALQDPARYAVALETLYAELAEISRYAGDLGPTPIIVEQMYTPHQVPWTIEGGYHYIDTVTRRSGFPAYIALDTGHSAGQQRFLRPSLEALEKALDGKAPAPYLGPDSAYAVFDVSCGGSLAAQRDAAARIQKEIDRFPHMFSSRQDCSLYGWLEELGGYSPLMHLQQTNGASSGHLPFTAANNETGIVHPRKVLEAIARCYQKEPRPGMPERCREIYLTFEIFPHTTDRPREILPPLAESVRYWRKWIPEDGVSLDALLAR